MSISIERAVGIARKYAPESIIEEALLSESLGRVLAQDVFAPITQPPFDRSPLDGYAVCAEDTEGASQEAPVQLQVVDHLCAGAVANIPLQRGGSSFDDRRYAAGGYQRRDTARGYRLW